jgi:hypothetical protein
MTKRTPSLLMIFVAAFGTAAGGVVQAQTVVVAQTSGPAEDVLNSTLVLDAGLFILGTHTSANLNGQGTTNPQINFDQAFGTGYDTQRFRLDGLWRITPTQHVEFMYFTNSVSRTKTLDKDIAWGDDQFLANADVTAKTRLSVYELGYEYAFMHKPTFELAASFGIHFTRATLGLSGMANVTNPGGGGTSVAGQTDKSASVPAPLPVIGLRTGWAFADNWMLDAQVQVFDFSYDQFHGNWTDFRAGISYWFNRHIGVGAGYDDFSTHLSIDKPNWDGHLNVGYRGALIYVTGAL